jgi:hypothetical protein
MDSKFHCLRWGCFFLLLFFTVSCSMKLIPKRPEGQKEFTQEISRLEKLAREHSDPSVRTQSHLQLAFLYLNYRNPQLNYTRALQEMENYLSLAPAKEQTEDLWDWLAALREIDHLRNANKGLRDEIATLKEMNHKMGETLEKLKNLDRQMEEKRRLIK